MTKYIQIAPNRLLAVPAAQSYFRQQDQGMPAGGINDAYRPHTTQVRLFLDRYTPRAAPNKGPYGDVRWYKGTRYVRTSPKGSAAVPGGPTSRHESGLALDIASASKAHAWIKKHGRAHGWVADVPGEPWHFEYRANLDQHKNKPASNTTPEFKDEDMKPRYGNRSATQALSPNRWTTVRVTDKNGVSTAFGAKWFDTLLTLGIKAPTGTQVRVRAYKMNYATGKRGYTYDTESKADSPKTTGNTVYAQFHAEGECSPNERVRFEIYTWNDNVTITSASYRTKEWN